MLQTSRKVVQGCVCYHLLIANGVEQGLDEAPGNVVQLFVVRRGCGGSGALAGGLSTVLHCTVDDPLAKGLDYGNRFSHLCAQEGFRDGPEWVLDPFGGSSRGIVERQGEVVVGVHFHLWGHCQDVVRTWCVKRHRHAGTAYVICHLAHQLACDFEEDSLQICLTATATCGFEIVDALGQVLRQGDIGEDLEVLGAQEAQAGFALDPP